MAPLESVFLSYSRADYYFAESLARHISNRGLPIWMDSKDLRPGRSWKQDLEAAIDEAACLILIVSSHSLKSDHVRKEWQRAFDQRKRIILVSFGRGRVPEELSDCERIDFRGEFQQALDTLMNHLTRNTSDRSLRRPSLLPRVPPWVLLFAIVLAIPTAGYLLTVNWMPGAKDPLPLKIPLWAAMPLCMVLFAWFMSISFLRRRMGMSRLLVSLVFLSAFYLYPLGVFLLRGPGALGAYPRVTVHLLAVRWPLWAVVGAVPLVGLYVLLIVGPEDLLRWMPTGRVWDWYRAKWVSRYPNLVGLSTLRGAREFQIINDPDDSPAAKLLEEMEANDTNGSASPPSKTSILLITNRTRVPFLIEQASRVDTELLILVGSSIRLAPQLEELWRRQWIDFRHWDLNVLEQPKLPSVPEAVTSLSLPWPVQTAHQILCALIALLFVLIGLASSTGATDAEASLALYIDLWLWIIARSVRRRSIRWTAFAINSVLAGLSALLFVYWELRRAIPAGLSLLRALIVVAFLIVVLLLSARDWRSLVYWFPKPDGWRFRRGERVGCARSWQTLLWCVIYLFLWIGVLRLNV